MAKRIQGITIELDGETQGLDRALRDVNKRSRSLNSELRDVERLLKFDPGNTEALAQKQRLLGDQVENTSQKLNQLRNAEKQVARQFQSGEIGEEQYRAFQREVQFTERELQKFKKQLSDVGKTKSIKKSESDMRELKQETDKADKAAKDLGSSFKKVAKRASVLGAAGSAAIGGFVQGMEEYNRLIGRLETNAITRGFDPKQAEDFANQIASITGETDSAVETVSNLFATDLSDNQIAQAIEEINGAAIKFSDTLKTEGIADGLQETLSTGSAVGQFAELLERSNVDLDTFNAGLAQAQANGTATNYAMQQLSSLGLQETLDKYKETNPELYESMKAQQELTSSSAELATTLTPLVTNAKEFLTTIIDWVNQNVELIKSFDNVGDGLQAFLGKLLSDGANIVGNLAQGIIKNLPRLMEMGMEMLENIIQGITNNVPMLFETWSQLMQQQALNIQTFLPQLITLGVTLLQSLIQGLISAIPLLVEGISQVITNMVTVILESLPILLQQGITILNAIIQGIINNLPLLAEAVLTLLTNLVTTITQNLPLIIQAGISLLNSLIDGIIKILPTLIDTAIMLIENILTVLFDNLPLILDAGVKLLDALIDGIIDMLPELISAALRLIIELVGELIANLPKIIAAGVDLIFALIEGLIDAIPDIISAIPKIVTAIFDAFGDVDWAEIGINIIEGLKDGLTSMAGSLVDSVKGVASDAIEGAKNLLGIHSPSRVFREIGEFTGEGLELGILSMGRNVAKAGQKLGEMSIPKMPKYDLSYENNNQPNANTNASQINVNDNELLSVLQSIAKYMQNGQTTVVQIGEDTVATAVNNFNAVADKTNYMG
ncbi:hypothetical protein Pryu01_03063 [Paraliobacillus ryukyuensis]|uniref:Phage-related minor tail protein n=1 Tax=Paraliobacillus ryukyuensis TaxID=200904 RepID=A0A366DSQ8_9BACI|nr:hypothetical protein [Paraliobacillus ryukyuensis]RBO92294.1 phage-related minor tail protein [Paraliobacillus ryukyuensis]